MSGARASRPAIRFSGPFSFWRVPTPGRPSTPRARAPSGTGFLTAYEVTGLDLRDTELVNLTACETGVGEVTPDGVVGVRQAFVLAGARAVTMSMWRVPTLETVEQMVDFYIRWLGPDASECRYAPPSGRHGWRVSPPRGRTRRTNARATRSSGRARSISGIRATWPRGISPPS